MPAFLVLPEPLLASTAAFLAAQGIPLQALAAAPEAPAHPVLAVRQGDRGQESAPDLLVAGGRISCPVALGLARRLGLPFGQLGMLLDELHVKVHDCSLGCF